MAWGTSLCCIYMARGDPVSQKGRESSFVISIDSLMKMSLVNRGSWQSLLAIPIKGIKQTGTLLLPLGCQKAKSSSGQMEGLILSPQQVLLLLYLFGVTSDGAWGLPALCWGESSPHVVPGHLHAKHTSPLSWLPGPQVASYLDRLDSNKRKPKKEKKNGESQMPRQGVGVRDSDLVELR